MTRARRRLVGALLCVGSALWCGSAAADTPSAASAALAASTPATTAEIVIRDYQFVPAVLQIRAGTTVIWINKEKRTSHTVLFTGPGGMESERLFPGDSWQRRFDTPGDHPYICGPHPEMKGLISVVP